jgi:hypothetical protein
MDETGDHHVKQIKHTLEKLEFYVFSHLKEREI